MVFSIAERKSLKHLSGEFKKGKKVYVNFMVRL